VYWGKTFFLRQRELDLESGVKVDQLILAAKAIAIRLRIAFDSSAKRFE
jgi:hypothetical protein